MTSNVLNDIYSHLLEDATKMKQLPPVFIQVHVSNRFDLLTWFLLKFAGNKWVVCFFFNLFAYKFVFQCYWNLPFVIKYISLKMSKSPKRKVVIKHCDLKSHAAEGISRERVGPEPALSDSSKKRWSLYDWQAVITNLSERLTTSTPRWRITGAEVIRPVLCGASYRSTF